VRENLRTRVSHTICVLGTNSATNAGATKSSAMLEGFAVSDALRQLLRMRGTSTAGGRRALASAGVWTPSSDERSLPFSGLSIFTPLRCASAWATKICLVLEQLRTAAAVSLAWARSENVQSRVVTPVAQQHAVFAQGGGTHAHRRAARSGFPTLFRGWT
jgi:hypothetical protein